MVASALRQLFQRRLRARCLPLDGGEGEVSIHRGFERDRAFEQRFGGREVAGPRFDRPHGELHAAGPGLESVSPLGAHGEVEERIGGGVNAARGGAVVRVVFPQDGFENEAERVAQEGGVGVGQHGVCQDERGRFRKAELHEERGQGDGDVGRLGRGGRLRWRCRKARP